MLKPILDYKQYDTRWGSMPYRVSGESSTIKSAGCGPTALAIVLSSLVNVAIDPVTCASWSLMKGYKYLNQGTAYAYLVAQAAEYGVPMSRLNTANIYKNINAPAHDVALQTLKDGGWLIACMGKGTWTSAGHYIVVYGYENGYVYISDPASIKTNRLKNTWDLFKSEVKYYWAVPASTVKSRHGLHAVSVRQHDFVRECQYVLGAKIDGVPGPNTMAHTVSVSRTKNRKHSVVRCLQKVIGVHYKEWDGIAGNVFDVHMKRFQKANGCVTDGEATAGGRTWKKLFNLI